MKFNWSIIDRDRNQQRTVVELWAFNASEAQIPRIQPKSSLMDSIL